MLQQGERPKAAQPFERRASVRGGWQQLLSRAWFIVRLPAGKNIVMDAKAPLSADLPAIETRKERTRRVKCQDHTRQICDHPGRVSSLNL